MKIRLIKIGKYALPVDDLVATYVKRTGSFTNLEVKHYKNLEQAETFLSAEKAKPGCFLVLLDERGKQLSSPGLAQLIREKTESSQIKSLNFVVGGPFGLGDPLRAKADLLWSFSPAVFPSDLAWLLLCEQVYRAFTILQGSPYHHEG